MEWTEYIYVSDRLIGDIVDQVQAQEGERELADVTLRLPFLSVANKKRTFGVNRYRAAALASEIVADWTGTLAFPGPFVHGIARASWWDVRIDDGGYRVAWLVLQQTGDEGRFFATLLGSVDHFVGYDADHPSKAGGGWRPSSVKGLRDIVAAWSRAHRRFDDQPRADEEDQKHIVLEATFLSRTLLAQKDAAGTARVEFVARVYYGLSLPDPAPLFGGEDVYDALYVGTPLWIRTPTRDAGEPTSEHGGILVVEGHNADLPRLREAVAAAGDRGILVIDATEASPTVTTRRSSRGGGPA